MRAALWRTGVRNFHLQGYLTQLDWQENLLRHAHLEAERNEITRLRRDQANPNLLETENDSRPKEPLGVEWVVIGNPFLEAQLSDLCMLEISGTWTAKKLPAKADEIQDPFIKVLNALDPKQLTIESSLPTQAQK